MQGEQEDALVAVQLRYEFYRDGYRRVLGLVAASVVINIVLACVVLFVATNPPPPRYFATSPDGQIIPVRPLNEPIYGTADIIAWATNLAITAYSYDYVNYRSDLQALAGSFTSDGWSSFLGALEGSRMLDTVMAQKLVMTAVPIGAPTVQQQGVLNGKYSWKILVPMLVKLSGSVALQQPVQVYMMIQRVSLVNNPKGIAVSSFVVSESNIPNTVAGG